MEDNFITPYAPIKLFSKISVVEKGGTPEKTVVKVKNSDKKIRATKKNMISPGVHGGMGSGQFDLHIIRKGQ